MVPGSVVEDLTLDVKVVESPQSPPTTINSEEISVVPDDDELISVIPLVSPIEPITPLPKRRPGRPRKDASLLTPPGNAPDLTDRIATRGRSAAAAAQAALASPNQELDHSKTVEDGERGKRLSVRLSTKTQPTTPVQVTPVKRGYASVGTLDDSGAVKRRGPGRPPRSAQVVVNATRTSTSGRPIRATIQALQMQEMQETPTRGGRGRGSAEKTSGRGSASIQHGGRGRGRASRGAVGRGPGRPPGRGGRALVPHLREPDSPTPKRAYNRRIPKLSPSGTSPAKDAPADHGLDGYDLFLWDTPSKISKDESSESDEEPLAIRQTILSALQVQKRNLLEQKSSRLRVILDRHDTVARELYYLENNLPLLEWDPRRVKADKGERIVKYLQGCDIRTIVAKEIAIASQNSRRLAKQRIGTRGIHHKHDNSLSDLIDTATTTIDALIPRSALLNLGFARYSDLDEYLRSYILIDDEELTREDFNARAEKEAEVEVRIARFKRLGLLKGVTVQQLERRPDSARPCHWTSLVNEMKVVSNGFTHAGRERVRVTKAMSKAVARYWELKLSEGERVAMAEERRTKRAMKEVQMELSKRWKLVEQIINIQHSKLVAEEQREAGKRQLDRILEQSSQVLQNRHMSQRSASPTSTIRSGRSAAGADDDEFAKDESESDLDISEESDSGDDELAALRNEMDMPVDALIDSGYLDMEEHKVYTSDDESDDSGQESVGEQNADGGEVVQNGSERYDEPEVSAEVDNAAERNTENGTAPELENAPEQNHENDMDHDTSLDVIQDVSTPAQVQEPLAAPVYSAPAYANDDMDDQDSDADLVSLQKPDLRTPIPFLLKHSLREYQHVGLDWMAGLYENGLNGILADEMGLGKTIQTIALFAHLACEKGIWGQHLIVVPTSVMLNWECEFKKWLPGFKLLTYYGSISERAAKRVGWSKPNAFHVCITSYQIVLRDHHIFRRKKWSYLVLDEAHNIKNFRSQRWQTLLGFNTDRRLLLTGTPLQNNLMELWSLLYFLMPGDNAQTDGGFAGHQEFKEWFEKSVTQVVGDGTSLLPSNMADDDTRESVARLHAVLRPYILRRLKADVEKQMPGKFEHVVKCRLSKRQRFLYDDFMSRAKTREDLASGNYLSIVNVLMQLRKVCNHPDLFEERPVVTGFAMPEGGVPGKILELEETVLWHKLIRWIDAGETSARLPRLGLQIVTWQNENQTKLYGTRIMELEAWQYLWRNYKEAEVAEIQARSLITSGHRYSNLKEWTHIRQWREQFNTYGRWQMMVRVNHLRCSNHVPIYGYNLRDMCLQLGRRDMDQIIPVSEDPRQWSSFSSVLRTMVKTPMERSLAVSNLISRFSCVTPAVRTHPFRRVLPPSGLLYPKIPQLDLKRLYTDLNDVCCDDPLSFAKTHLEIAFPDKRLVQFDCGKLQTLDRLLRDLKGGGHRALIFTQMTRMLDILEVFLNLHGHRYLRLDGSTKVEQRQILMERFNNDKRILVFILSTRSGGLGMNLTGADTVIFYDSDWNPAMDAQAQDRAHRIGQTREVHIYRFVSEHTIEENMLRKAQQKRRLDQIVIQAGDFTTEWVQKTGEGRRLGDWRDWLDPETISADDADGSRALPRGGSGKEWEQAIMQAEDESDVVAMRRAEREAERDVEEFVDEEAVAKAPATTKSKQTTSTSKPSEAPASAQGVADTLLEDSTITASFSPSHPTSHIPDVSTPAEESANLEFDNEFSEQPMSLITTTTDIISTKIPEPASLDEYLFRLQIYRLGLSDILDWRDFAEELRQVGEEEAELEAVAAAATNADSNTAAAGGAMSLLLPRGAGSVSL
ncbi:SNF2 family N-terminal domain-containing protein [Phlyctochytrium arcticum]|nr:SNF2 family N-terminal domain-containing protein [Phlyctochytrium arcticum]